jgi:hypothetical protein
MCILTWGDATNYGDALPIPCSLFDETFAKLYKRKKTPIEKGEKGGTRREDQHSKKGEHPRVQNGIPRGAKESNKALCLKPLFSHEKQVRQGDGYEACKHTKTIRDFLQRYFKRKILLQKL